MRFKALALVFPLALGLLVAPLPAEAQKKTGKVHRIAIVHPVVPVADMTETGYFGYRWIFSELRRLGYVEGENLVVERRSAEGRPARFPELAREVVRLQPEVILASSNRLVLALKGATTTIPIVGLTGSPIAGGLVSNLARPGGNITGFSVTPGDEIYGKHLAFLRETVPAGLV